MKKLYLLNNDYLFKNIFRNKKYLRHLFKTFFKVSVRKIEYLNTELIKDNLVQKVGIVDLLLKVDGKITILEFQNIDRHNFKKRLLFYSSSVIAKYGLNKCEDYEKLKPIKVYAIINYKNFNNEILDTIKLKNNHQIFTKNLEYKIFDLTKIDNTSNTYELASLFKNRNLDELSCSLKNETNKEIFEKIKGYNLDEGRYKKMDDIAQMMMKEEEHYETAIKVGERRGKRIGKHEGKIEGKLEIAQNMFKKGINVNDIIEITGLTKKQILSLK